MTSEDYRILNKAVDNWLKEKEDYELRKNKVFGLNPKPYLWLFSIAFVYIFFVRDYKSDRSTITSSPPFAVDYILYEKPDNESRIIVQGHSKAIVNILNETKYYYEVEFSKNGTNYRGYINKGKISR